MSEGFVSIPIDVIAAFIIAVFVAVIWGILDAILNKKPKKPATNRTDGSVTVEPTDLYDEKKHNNQAG